MHAIYSIKIKYTLFISVFILFVLAGSSCNKDLPIQNADKISINTYQILRSDTILRSVQYYSEGFRWLQQEVFYSVGGAAFKKDVYHYTDTLLIQIESFSGDKLQRLVEQSWSGNRLMQRTESDGVKLISRTRYFWYPTGKIRREVTEYLYDPDNPIISVINYDKNGLRESMFRQIYEDSSRLVISRYEMDAWKRNNHPETGLPEEELHLHYFGYHESADTISLTAYRYSAQGQLLSEQYLVRGDPAMPDSVLYRYDTSGLKTVQFICYPASVTGLKQARTDTIHYAYDASKRLISERFSESGLEILYRYSE